MSDGGQGKRRLLPCGGGGDLEGEPRRGHGHRMRTSMYTDRGASVLKRRSKMMERNGMCK